MGLNCLARLTGLKANQLKWVAEEGLDPSRSRSLNMQCHCCSLSTHRMEAAGGKLGFLFVWKHEDDEPALEEGVELVSGKVILQGLGAWSRKGMFFGWGGHKRVRRGHV